MDTLCPHLAAQLPPTLCKYSATPNPSNIAKHPVMSQCLDTAFVHGLRVCDIRLCVATLPFQYCSTLFVFPLCICKRHVKRKSCYIALLLLWLHTRAARMTAFNNLLVKHTKHAVHGKASTTIKEQKPTAYAKPHSICGQSCPLSSDEPRVCVCGGGGELLCTYVVLTG